MTPYSLETELFLRLTPSKVYGAVSKKLAGFIINEELIKQKNISSILFKNIYIELYHSKFIQYPVSIIRKVVYISNIVETVDKKAEGNNV